MVDFETLNILINIGVALCFLFYVLGLCLLVRFILSMFKPFEEKAEKEKAEKEKAEKEKAEKLNNEIECICSKLCSLEHEVDNLYFCKSDKRSRK